MAKKIRNYPSKADYEARINQFFEEHRDEVIRDMCFALGYDDFERLKHDECHMRFGFDCGFTKLLPRNAEMRYEWILDEHGRKGEDFWAEIYPRFSWDCQSLTCKRPQAEYMLAQLGLEDEFMIVERLD